MIIKLKNNIFYISIYILIITITIFLKLKYILFFDSNVDELLIPSAILNNNSIQLHNLYDYLNNFLMPILNVIKHSTYAPGQIILIRVLLYFSSSYNTTLILSRLVSFFFSIIAINLISLIFLKSDKKYGKHKSILSVIILSFSWEFFIFSLQIHPYLINVLLTTLLTYFIILNNKTDYNYIEFILLTILPWFNYEILFFYPSFFLIRFYKFRKLLTFINKKRINVFYIFIPFLSCFIIYYFLLNHYNNSGLNFSSGINNEFIFNINNLNVIEIFKYFYNFFIIGGLKVTLSMILFVPETSILYNFFASTYLIFFFIGIYTLFRQKNEIIIFFILCLITFIFIIIGKKIAFSPTRHYLIFLPFFVIFITEGIYFIIIKLKKFKLIISIYILGIIFSFLYTFNNEISKRLDPISENLVIDIINKNNINFIIAYDNTLNLRLMNKIKIPILDCGGGVNGIYLNKFNKNNLPNKILLISKNSSLTYNNKNIIYNQIIHYKLNNIINIPFNKKVDTLINFAGLSQTEYSSLTYNGKNSLYATILIN